MKQANGQEDNKLQQFLELVEACQRIVFFGGA